MSKRIISTLLIISMLVLFVTENMTIPSYAASNIVINGIDIGYADGSYFTKNGSSCYNTYWSNNRCHKNDVCVSATNSHCNCMRYWPTGNPSTCTIDLLSSQCFGFARYCQWKVYGRHDGSSSSYFTDITGIISASNCSASTLKTKLLNCPPATHLRTGDGSHSISIVSTNNSGANVADCNSDGYCIVRYKTYSWSELSTYLKGKGGVSYANAYKYSISAPTSARISINKESFSIGELFTMNFSTDVPAQYYLAIIDTSTGERVVQGTVTDTYTNAFQKAGKYEAYFSASNSSGDPIDSNWITFYVFGPQPTTATLSTNKTELNVGESITLSTYTDAYYVRIYTRILKGSTEVYNSEIPYNFTYTPSSAGVYKAYVSTTTHQGGVDSNWVTFYVGKYNVTLNNQSATTAGTTSATATYGKAMPSITVPKKTGYTFGGYYTGTNGSGTQYYTSNGTSARTWDKTSATTLYAKWTANKYTVTLNNQSATTAGSTSVTATYGLAMPSITVPKKTGYTFGGYYTGTNGSGTQYYKADGTSARNWDKTSAQTLYAQWTTNKYTVTFKNYDGTVLETKSVNYGSSVTYSGATPTKKADAQYTYTFSGWDKALTNITANTVITAKFTSTVNKCTVTFKNYDGTVLETKSVNYGSSVTYSGAKPAKKADAQYTYTFSGWDKALTNITANTVITAKFTSTVNKYTVTFDANGGSNAPSSQTKNYDEALTLSFVKPSRTGYTFANWNTKADGSGDSYNSGSSYTKNVSATLYAQWSANTYTVVYDANGGIGTMPPSAYVYDVAQTLPSCSFLLADHTFLGWSTEKTAEKAKYINEASVINLSDRDGATITLYAVWEKNTPENKCGENVFWEIDESGTLTISGTGDMYTYTSKTMPWSEYRDQIQKVIFQNGVTSIAFAAFSYHRSLEEAVLPSTLKTINRSAFFSCSKLKSILIPDSVTAIDYNAFGDCDSLTEIQVDSKNLNYCSENGILFDKNKTTLVQYPAGKSDTIYTVPKSVRNVEESAFYGCRFLTSVSLGDAVCYLGDNVFKNCYALKEISLSNAVTKIKHFTFDSCYKLKDVYFIGSEADWRAISVAKGNTFLTNATVHFVSPKRTKTTVKNTGDVYEIDVQIFNIDTPCNILAVGYKNDNFISFTEKITDGKDITLTLNGDFDEIRVMSWDSIFRLTPLCKAEIIPADKWITE